MRRTPIKRSAASGGRGEKPYNGLRGRFFVLRTHAGSQLARSLRWRALSYIRVVKHQQVNNLLFRFPAFSAFFLLKKLKGGNSKGWLHYVMLRVHITSLQLST